jgi:hypothetical protein
LYLSRLCAGAFALAFTSGLLLLYFYTGNAGAAMSAIITGAGAVGILSGILYDTYKESKDAGD